MAVPLTLSSVPAQTPYVQYVATSNQTVFPYPFEITLDSDLVCLVNAVQQGTDSGYTLSGQGANGGGNLTFNSGQLAGTVITLYRNIPIARVTQLAANGTFFSSNFNNEYNRVYLIMQQLQQATSLCLQIPNTNVPSGGGTTLLPANYANKYLSFDANGNPTPAILTSSGALTAALVGGVLYPQTATEASNSVVPTSYQYPAGNVLRYGADASGVADSSVAINNALLCNGVVYAPVGTYKIGSQITLNSNNVLMGDGPNTVFNLTNASVVQDYLAGSAVSYVTVTKIKFSCSGGSWTPANYVGVVGFRANSQHCVIFDCEFTGYATQGVLLESSSYCRVVGNRFTNFVGTSAGDGADIHGFTDGITNLAYNVIEGNYCFGGGSEGIAFETSSTPNTFMFKNIIANNRVGGGNTTYGILVYTHQVNDSYTQVIGNYVENVSGSSVAQSGASGAGIYCANQGGALIANNVIYNCCTATSSQSLAPGGIGVVSTIAQALSGVTITGTGGQFSCSAATTLLVGMLVTISGTLGGTGSITGYASPTTYKVSVTNGSTTFTLTTLSGSAIVTTSGTPTGLAYSLLGLSPVTIANNEILDMAQGNPNGTTPSIAGIYVAGPVTGVTIEGNTISQLVAGALTSGIYLGGGNFNATIAGNTVNLNNAVNGGNTRGIYINANNANIFNVAVTGNTVLGFGFGGISFEQVGGAVTNNVTLTGNNIGGGSSAAIPLRMANVAYATVAGNNVQAVTVVALFASVVTNSTFDGNIFYSTGANAVQTAGANTGSFLSKSNILTGLMNNAGTAFHMEQTGTTSPVTGTWITGDIVFNSAGSGAFAWSCTAGGTSGTWVPLATPVAVSTGWGSPTGASVANNYSGSAATLAQTSAAVAELIVLLKAAGILGT